MKRAEPSWERPCGQWQGDMEHSPDVEANTETWVKRQTRADWQPGPCRRLTAALGEAVKEDVPASKLSSASGKLGDTGEVLNLSDLCSDL